MCHLKTNNYLLIAILFLLTIKLNAQEIDPLKNVFKEKFLIGTALNMRQVVQANPKEQEILKTHFNSIVAENAMKSMYLQPKEGEFNFSEADQFVEFGERHGMHIVGHTLIWHSQAPSWFFVDERGNDVSRTVLIDRMKKHIHTVVSRYKGRIKGWDVVNEAVFDNGDWRTSKFYEIIGPDFMKLAFQFAAEADPEAELYYNDYNTAIPSKRMGIAHKIKELLEAGVRVDGLGMQEHHGLDFPSLNDIEGTIIQFSSLGLNVMVTELDISVLPHARANQSAEISNTDTYKNELNPYKEGLPIEIQERLAKRYTDLFEIYLKHADKISRVTFWGLSDRDSWLNNFPIQGRTNYPLWFDRSYQAKPFVQDIINLVN